MKCSFSSFFSFFSVPERASFQPYDDEKLLPEFDDDEEEEDLPKKFGLQSRLHRALPKEVDESAAAPPPIPERSGQPKVMMLRLMKSATNTLKS